MDRKFAESHSKRSNGVTTNQQCWNLQVETNSNSSIESVLDSKKKSLSFHSWRSLNADAAEIFKIIS